MSEAQRLSVLVIDPDEEITVNLKSLLSDEGYQVSTITDPAGRARRFATIVTRL